MELATELGVAYSGIRRRVFTADVPSIKNSATRQKFSPEVIEAAVARVREAKAQGVARYHAQLAVEYYENGISLGQIAKGLGISNAAPLYYGVQRHIRSVPRTTAL
jgi:transposase-like protein